MRTHEFSLTPVKSLLIMRFLVSRLHKEQGSERLKSTRHIELRQPVSLVDTSKLLFAKMIGVVLFLF